MPGGPVAPSDRSEDDLPKIQVSFPEQNFEGPLDLLLSLIQKHELDILQLPIAFITEKYLEFIRVMQLMNLDLASEYLVMAATLAHIKSKMLLPQVPEEQDGEAAAEEEEDPREALIRRLLEYQKYKLAAEQLRERSTFGQDAFFRGAPLSEAVDPGLPPLAEVPLFALAEAFQRVLDQSRVKLTHDVVADRISLTDRMHQLVDFLRGKERVRFEELFTGVTTREGLVITFLALLEMSKLRLTRLYQDEPLGPILVELGSAGTSPYEAGSEFERPPAAEAEATAESSAESESAATDASPEDASDDEAPDAPAEAIDPTAASEQEDERAADQSAIEAETDEPLAQHSVEVASDEGAPYDEPPPLESPPASSPPLSTEPLDAEQEPREASSPLPDVADEDES